MIYLKHPTHLQAIGYMKKIQIQHLHRTLQEEGSVQERQLDRDWLLKTRKALISTTGGLGDEQTESQLWSTIPDCNFIHSPTDNSPQKNLLRTWVHTPPRIHNPPKLIRDKADAYELWRHPSYITHFTDLCHFPSCREEPEFEKYHVTHLREGGEHSMRGLVQFISVILVRGENDSIFFVPL